MMMNRQDGGRGDVADRPDDDFAFHYAARVSPAGALTWTVWCDVEGRDARGEGPTMIQARGGALALAIEARQAARERAFRAASLLRGLAMPS